jgi:hypothetical protein
MREEPTTTPASLSTAISKTSPPLLRLWLEVSLATSKKGISMPHDT